MRAVSGRIWIPALFMCFRCTALPTFADAQVADSLKHQEYPGPEAGAENLPRIWLQPDTIRLGQPFSVTVFLPAPEGWTLETPDSSRSFPGLQALGPLRSLPWVEADRRRGVRLTLSLLPLRPGYRPLPTLSLRLRSPEGQGAAGQEQWVQVPLGGVNVRSVLPRQDSAITPQPPILPHSSEPKPLSSPLIPLAAAVLSGTGWFLARRWGPGDTALDPRSAPDVADTGRAKGLCELLAQAETENPAGPELSRIVEEVVSVLRRILSQEVRSSVSPRTTPELLRILRESASMPVTERLERILVTSDQLRFRGHPPTVEEVRTFGEAFRSWLEEEEARRAAGPVENPHA